MAVKRNYKDSLFNFLFGNKKEALGLYNALNGSSYSDESMLEITTIEGAMYVGFKNEVSFLLDNLLNLYEHQSSVNPNMPVRGMIYFSSEYQKYITEHDLNIYGEKRLRLPAPRYVVLCNAESMKEDRKTYRLSDMFTGGAEGCLECTAEVININAGHNKEILGKCPTLHDYAELVSRARKYGSEEKTSRAAIERAIDECIDEGILSDILLKRKSEVIGMILEEYDEEKQRRQDRRDALAEGKAECILELLENIGPVPDEIRQMVTSEIDSKKLSCYLKAAAGCSSFDDFEKMIIGS